MTLDGWAKLLTPVNLWFLTKALGTTLELALLVATASFPIAAVLGIYRASTSGVLRWPSTVLVDGIRNTPLLVLVFFMRFGPPTLGFRLDSFTAGAVGMTIYSSANLAEVFRAGIESVPRGQRQAAMAVGLNAFQTYTRIVLPQALRNMLPALVGQFIILVQGTSLISAFSVIELTGAGEILFNRYGNPLETYAFIGLVYFAVDFALANVRALLERRLGTTGVAPAD